MRYEKASKYLQSRFNMSGFCMICGERIHKIEEFEYIAVPLGRCKYYNFFHTACLQEAHRLSVSDAASQLEEDRAYGRG